MSTDTRSSRQIQVLRDLGLSRAESEVYLACLQMAAAGAGLLSSYRVAQEMGRDPANVGKIVNTLAHLQAIRVVQEKPRLFMAVPPGEFTDHLLGRMRRRGAEAISLLEDFGSPEAEGVAQALAGRAQALARAQVLVAGCARDLLVAGSPEIIRELGADLERAAEKPGCRVRVVSPQAFSSAVVEVSTLLGAGRLGHDQNEAWLTLAGDDQCWLVALIPQQDSPATGPCGWWAAGSPLARVWAEFLESSWRAGVAAVPAAGFVLPEVPEPAGSAPAAVAAGPGPEDGFVPEVVAAARAAAAAPAPAPVPASAPAVPAAAPADRAASPEAAPAAPAAAAAWARPIPAEEAEKAGFSFLFKHDRKPGKGGR